MDLLLKGIIGGLMTALIAYFSKKNPAMSGILILFPTFSILAVWFTGSRGDTNAMQICALSSLKTIPCFVGFMGTVWLLSSRFDFKIVIALSLAVWFCVALIIHKLA